jgi:hypothetical protein
MPDKDVEALPLKERPHCVYEREEYDHVTFSLEKEKVTKEKPIASNDAWASDDPDAEGASISFGPTFSFSKEKVGEVLLHHNIATFQVMLTRAQAALGWHTYTEETRADGDKYTMRSTKISALLQAQLSIARELRQWLRLLATDAVRLALNLTTTDPQPQQPMGLASAMRPLMLKSKGVIEEVIEHQRRIDAGEIHPDDHDVGFDPPLPAPA